MHFTEYKNLSFPRDSVEKNHAYVHLGDFQEETIFMRLLRLLDSIHDGSAGPDLSYENVLKLINKM